MPISHKHKLIFIHIPKNAGTSITNHLQMSDVGHHKWQYYKIKYPTQWENYTKISVIRNPWGRVVSCYEYARMEKSYWHSSIGHAKAGKHLDYDLLKNLDFKECLNKLKNEPNKLKHQGWSDQSNYIVNDSKIVVDYTIKMDNINEKLSKILGFKITIPVVNSSNNANYKSYYKTPQMKNIVKDYYKKDIKLFNFKFNESNDNLN
jgi:hypothetical protein